MTALLEYVTLSHFRPNKLLRLHFIANQAFIHNVNQFSRDQYMQGYGNSVILLSHEIENVNVRIIVLQLIREAF